MSEHFLAIKLADLGDVLTITPALRALRRTFPNARIDALVTPIGAIALSGLDSVDRTLTFEKSAFDRPTLALGPLSAALRLGVRLRRERYDRVFLFHHLFTPAGRLKYRALLATTRAPWRAGLAEEPPSFLTRIVEDRGYGLRHEADYWLDVVGLAGARLDDPRFELAIDETDRRRAAALLGDTTRDSPQLRIALFPGGGAFSLARRWPAERFAEVGRRLAGEAAVNDGLTSTEVLVLGSGEERSLADAVARAVGPAGRSLAGRTDLKTLAAVVERCDLVVGNDGGISHVAVAIGTPVVAIFGPSDAVSWGPYGGVAWRGVRTPPNRPVVVSTSLLCSPCLYRGFLPGTARGCRSRDCLMQTTPDVVVDAARHLLSGRRK